MGLKFKAQRRKEIGCLSPLTLPSFLRSLQGHLGPKILRVPVQGSARCTVKWRREACLYPGGGAGAIVFLILIFRGALSLHRSSIGKRRLPGSQRQSQEGAGEHLHCEGGNCLGPSCNKAVGDHQPLFQDSGKPSGVATRLPTTVSIASPCPYERIKVLTL